MTDSREGLKTWLRSSMVGKSFEDLFYFFFTNDIWLFHGFIMHMVWLYMLLSIRSIMGGYYGCMVQIRPLKSLDLLCNLCVCLPLPFMWRMNMNKSVWCCEWVSVWVCEGGGAVYVWGNEIFECRECGRNYILSSFGSLHLYGLNQFVWYLFRILKI